MKFIFKYILFFLILLTLIPSEGCKKYEDGPLLSLRSKKARLVGVWKFKEAIVDGKDITTSLQNDNIGFESGSGSYYVSVNQTNDEEAILFGTWSFANNKEDLNIKLSADVIDTISGSAETIYIEYNFRIKELKYKEIKLDGSSKTTLKGKIESSNLSWTLKQ